jgi:hypothetical protein
MIHTDDVISDPVLIMGFPRSGTTWINKVVRNFLDVGLVNEGQFIDAYAKRYSSSDSISPEVLMRKLSKDQFFVLLDEVYGIRINWEHIKTDARARHYSGFVKLILAQIAAAMDKRIIGSKSPGFGWNIVPLLEHFPRSTVIHVIRDGRDCALSHYEMTWGRKNAFVVAALWQKYITHVRRNSSRCSNYVEVRYEDILKNPKAGFEKLRLAVVSGEDEDASLNMEAAERFAATIGPNDYDRRTRRWARKMSIEDQTIFETVATNMLADLGYEVKGYHRPISPLSKTAFMTSDRIQREWWNAARMMFKSIPEKKVRRS